MVEVCFAFLTMFLAVLFCGAVAIVIAHRIPALSGVRPVDLAKDSRVLLPAQLAAYFIVFCALWRLFAHYFGIGFFRALSWNWPARWPLFLVGGVLLAVVVQILAHLLPAPPELPIDKMLRTASDAWLMSAFGVLIAPFVEEVFFRGLLFPALTRRTGALLSLVLTSVLFGAVHAQQLAGAWVQVTCIMIVGTVLTAVRWRFHSLASSTLLHVGYNGALFVGLFIETRAFTNLAIR
jgi:hypothetical protein